MKQCRVCQVEKPFDEFYRHKATKDGFNSYCKSCNALKTKQWYQDNKEQRLSKSKKWSSANKGKKAAYMAKRRATIEQRTVTWADKQYISDLYENAAEANTLFKHYGISFHVDHIVPLNGALVSGLHTEDNLQVLSAQDNLTKSNSYEVI